MTAAMPVGGKIRLAIGNSSPARNGLGACVGEILVSASAPGMAMAFWSMLYPITRLPYSLSLQVSAALTKPREAERLQIWRCVDRALGDKLAQSQARRRGHLVALSGRGSVDVEAAHFFYRADDRLAIRRETIGRVHQRTTVDAIDPRHALAHRDQAACRVLARERRRHRCRDRQDGGRRRWAPRSAPCLARAD